MNITYLFHSGFLLEFNNQYIIFDYFKDNCVKQKMKDCGQICEKLLSKRNLITFFVSHSHYDHFDKEIFRLNSNAKYVISDDVKIKADNNIKLCSPYESFVFNGIDIKTFGSTDAGLSFLINVEGKNIFHAGDLNWWHWSGETEDERESARVNFFNEIDKIKGQEIDIAFFPVDPRLEEAYYFGGKYFIENIRPKHFIPMHFQDNYYITTKFFNFMETQNIEGTIIHKITKRGELLDI